MRGSHHYLTKDLILVLRLKVKVGMSQEDHRPHKAILLEIPRLGFIRAALRRDLRTETTLTDPSRLQTHRVHKCTSLRRARIRPPSRVFDMLRTKFLILCRELQRKVESCLSAMTIGPCP